ncbi:Cobalamin adenosyltransferase [Chloropicon primus]|uniref:Corrinoid adenosyltransferase MMAB n=1 Tax=Chloropicon primus TaxID=1764295 RepID=A0A5B8MIS6_9CHLO|nr:Cobalamin adenosyltransferase [Chloropicon primus]UPQ99739.1 Cobalamin adenosyltransferase [Chloropicon primus]|eukprot:QDZ20528.1 Cobalamin adenosyltransferase [Chloropicon primus]
MTSSSGSYKIYTKTGDEGTSSLYTGERREKSDAVFEALGDTDELNSQLGIAREYCATLPGSSELCEQLEAIQSRLLDVGSAVATPPERATEKKSMRVVFPTGPTEDLEKWIDAYDAEIPPLKNFILPSGGLAASFLHLARTTCRRAERKIVPLIRKENIQKEVGQYMNRLSDYLFTAARIAAKKAGKEEVIYRKQ